MVKGYGRTHPVCVTLPEKLIELVDEKAAEYRFSRSTIISHLLIAWIENEDKKWPDA